VLSGDADDSRKAIVAISRTATALDSVGGARRCLELAVDYAQNREQFGKPIGTFQAIKHKCADMLLAVESATSAAFAAAAAVDKANASDLDLDALAEAARVAHAYCGNAYVATAAETIQILGGIGFTWEHPAHLFYKRAKVNSVLTGTARDVRIECATVLGLRQHESCGHKGS
jgi:alkylation response protein AidB-like acyl-CoA dehydrogenase